MGNVTPLKPIACQGCPLFEEPIRVHPDAIPAPGGTTVLLLGEAPDLEYSSQLVPFLDRPGKVIQAAYNAVRKEYDSTPEGMARFNALQVHKAYTVQCASEKPSKAAHDKCKVHLDALIQTLKPTLIIPFGAAATEVLLPHIKNFESVRGTFVQGAVRRQQFYVCPTLAPKAVLAKPGLFDEMCRDLTKAFAFAEGGGLGADKHSEAYLRETYIFPRTVDEVKDVCTEIIGYSVNGGDPEAHLISVDTETNTLEPWDPTRLMIAISFAWDERLATTIILDHPDAWWTPEELEEVKYWVIQVLASKKPKALHNHQYDSQMIECAYGWPLENVAWDTMPGEHLLEEDKKGQYGLKNLTRARLPKYAGYEDKVDEERERYGSGTRAQEAKRFRKAMEKYEDRLRIYAVKQTTYEPLYARYSAAMDKWHGAKAAEKILAKSEKRRMDKAAWGKKPPKPRAPKPPSRPTAKEPFDYTKIPIPDLEFYAAIDADVTRQHVLHQVRRLRAEHATDLRLRRTVLGVERASDSRPVGRLMRTHVIPTSNTLSRMKYTGFPVDLPYLESVDTALQGEIDKAERELYESVGSPFDVSSFPQVSNILFNTGFVEDGQRVVVPLTDDIKRTKTGVSADEDTLLYIQKQYGYNFPKLLLTHRKASKARSPFLVNVRDHARIDGRMHASVHIIGTNSGRLSSSDENLQNIPHWLAGHNIKKIFRPLPGMTLIDTDAQGAEVRIFAAYAKDKQLIDAILAGMDTHSFFASKVFGLDYDEIVAAKRGDKSIPKERRDFLKMKRTITKRVVFGVLYGAGKYTISLTAGISEEEAQDVINLMFKMFPSIPEYIQATHNEIRLFKSLYTKTGRKRRFPLADQYMFRNRCFRQGVNFKIQSTSSDIVLWVMNELFPVVTNDMGGAYHATVHDSIVFSIPHKYTSQIKDVIYEYGTRRVAKRFNWLTVPFLWDVDAGPNYGEVNPIDDYLKGHTHDTTGQQEEREAEAAARLSFQ